MCPVFGAAATGRGTVCSGTSFEEMLLGLEGEEVIDPFDNEKALVEGSLEEGDMEIGPRDEVEDGRRPVMVFAEVLSVVVEVAKVAKLGGEVVGDRVFPNGETHFAGGKERNSGERASSSIER